MNLASVSCSSMPQVASSQQLMYCTSFIAGRLGSGGVAVALPLPDVRHHRGLHRGVQVRKPHACLRVACAISAK
jgi:hypothetical protein